MRRPARSRAARAAAWVAALSLSGSIAAAPAAGAPAQAATGSGTVAATAQLSAHRRPVEHAYVAPHGTKINVMGEWAHPDDDTDIIGPCGVWHQRYGTRCGVIQITRGEGGGNATGPEVGPALGLRRENEDRVAHYRSGTVDIYYVDRVDFFYNQSAPLTNHIWDHTETLRRVTRIIRTTQPDVYVGWTPTQAAGHGNHQVAGRLIWEGMKAAADPHMFPGQLRGSHALSTWQVKKVFSGGSTEGTGGTTSSANCLTGFAPASPTGGTVAGVWTGYDSPYAWPKGNVQDRPAGTPKIWQQVADEGASAYPTQSRVMYQGTSRPACPMFAQTDASVPFQPNTRPDGSANPRAGEDDAILFGAARQDPGGLPLGTLEHLSLSRFYVVPGAPFTATLQLRAPGRAVPAGTVRLMLPAGWTADGPRHLGRLSPHRAGKVTFTVTPAPNATTEQPARVAATWRHGRLSGYTESVVQVVPAVEGRFRRWGSWAEYDQWLERTAPAARRLGRSDAVQSVGVGRTITVPVDVHNWSATPRSGSVTLSPASHLAVADASQHYGPLAPGETKTLDFEVTNTDPSLPVNQETTMPITTTYGTHGSSAETLQLSVVPVTAIPRAGRTPTVDATEGPAEYPGPRLDLGRIWQGSNYCTGPSDCGVDEGGSAHHDWAKVSWSDDALYVFTHVVDDYQSYAVTPTECVAHWLADSVEIQVDPRGNASKNAMDTANTFKLGVFPFTDDPGGTNRNGANGPCWERDADHHQGYSTGPLADTVADAPNAPGVQVASSARWVGDNGTTTDHSYTGGGYDLEVKIPMADLPAAVDPQHIGLNITPYDNDDTAAGGTTTLRHIDNSTRLAWSAFGSVQSDPYRWGQATVDGYTPPADRPTAVGAPIVGHPNRDGTQSPQTIAQSARNRVPIAGRTPAPAGERITDVTRPVVRHGRVSVRITTSGRGTARLYGYAGNVHYTPVWTTSCTRQADPPPDWGMTACRVSDGSTPPWSPDMSGRLLGQRTLHLRPGSHRVSLAVSNPARFRHGGRVLISFDAANGGVQALSRR
jgi:LmbE family N-acetylglucosaminyl deacetylase